jgi:DNA-binding SARP family transcriptional activator
VNRLRIGLLGSFQVWRGAERLPAAAWPGGKALQLFKILVTYRHRAVASDELIEWLWPHLPPASAHNSLWVAVSRLRHLLEPESGRRIYRFLVTEAPGYRFAAEAGCEIDVDAFLHHVSEGQERQRQGELAAAVEAFRAAERLYRGDYLAEDRYEDWALPTRERLREAFLELQIALGSCCLALGRYREALAHARRALDPDPCGESAWRLVMEAHYRAGEPDQALRAYQRCRRLLAEELGVDPLPETAALHERILRTPPPRNTRHELPTAPPPDALVVRLPFVGREREWSLLSRLLQEAIAGRGHMVLIDGQGGIGKTRLLEELAGLATARGAQVLMARCYELEGNLAYAPVVEMLRSLLSTAPERLAPCPWPALAVVAELVPELRQARPDLPFLRPLSPGQERTRLLTCLAEVIRCCAQGEPLALLFDDLHWADRSSLQLVHTLGRQVPDRPLLVAGAYRSTRVEPGHPLAALQASLERRGLLTRLSLTAFQEEDVLLLVRILGGEALPAGLAHWLHRETEGQPFFLAEVLRTLAQEGLLVADDAGGWHLAGDELPDPLARWPLPQGVRAAALERLDRLPPEDRALLDQASVLGREFPLALLAGLLDRPETALAAQAERLAARGFLRPGGRYEFAHDLMRRAAYEALSEPRRRLLHRQAAEALLAMGAPAGSVATHYAAGDRPWLALGHALAAAEQAGQLLAYDEALAWCQQAITLAEAYPQAVPPGFRTRLHLQARALWYYRGDLERSLAAGRAALAAAHAEGDPAAELQALWNLAHDETQVAAGGPSGLQARALALAQDLGEPAALARRRPPSTWAAAARTAWWVKPTRRTRRGSWVTVPWGQGWRGMPRTTRVS